MSAPPETEDSDSLHTHPGDSSPPRGPRSASWPTAPHRGEIWLAGREAFQNAHEASRRAVPNAWLEADQPAAALIEAWGLLERNPDDRKLLAVFHQAIVDLALDRAAARRTAPRPRRLRIWGAYQTLDHFLKHTDDAQMLALGICAAREAARATPGDSLATRLEPEIMDEWAKALPRHLEYFRDTTRIARSLRQKKPILDRIRQTLPELAGDIRARPEIADTGARHWSGTAVLADFDWGQRPLAKPLGGIEAGKRSVRGALVRAFAKNGVQLLAPNPVEWGADSLEAMRRQGEIRKWAMERLDARGATRFRPRLPELRRNLAPLDADKVVLVSLDYGPPERSFDRNLTAMRVAWFGDAKSAWYFPQPYLMGAVFDARDGSVLGVARVNVWESTTETFLDEAATRLVKQLNKAP